MDAELLFYAIMNAMKRLAAYLFFALLTFGQVNAQAVDLSKSYYHFSLAKMHYFHKEYSEAIAEFEKAIAFNPDSSQLRVEFARTLEEAGEIRRAVEESEKAISLDPNNVGPHLVLGDIYAGYRESGQGHMLDKAIQSFSRAIELDAENRDALFALGRLLIVKQDHRAAAEVLGRLNRISPSIQGYYAQAVAYVEGKEPQRAIEILEQSLKLREDNVDHLKLLARLYEETDQYGKAIEGYQKLSEYSSDPEFRAQVGRLMVEEKRYKEAIPILQELAAGHPQEATIKLPLGRALKEEKRYSEAAEVFYDILKSDPNSVEANYELGLTLDELGERSQAIEKFDHLLKITEVKDGNYSEPQLKNRKAFQRYLGLLYLSTRQYDKAIKTFQQMSQASPEDYIPKLHLIYAYKDSDKLKEALSLSEQLLSQKPDLAFVIIARAQILSAADKLDKAQELLREEIKKNPDEEQFYLTASQLYLDHGKYKDAEKMAREGLARKPENERMEFQLGAIYERQKDFKEAETVFRKILERNPRHDGVLNYLGYMLADRGERLDEALGYVKKAVEIDPYNGAYLDSLGWAYFKLSQFVEAEIHLTRAAQLVDTDATVYDHLGDLYYKLGDYDKARKHYEKSVFFAKEEEENKRVREKLADLKKLLSQKR